jgi:PAS domain S-box-containing protein
MEDFDKTQQELKGEVEHLPRKVQSLRDQLEKKIPKYHKQEDVYRESEERYRVLVEKNPYGIQEIDVCGIIIYANKTHHEMYGYEDGYLIGRSIIDFLALDSQRDELLDYLVLLVKDQPPPRSYYQKIITAQGKERDIEVAWNYLHDTKGCVTGFISVLTDVTDREISKRALQDTKEKLETILSLSPAGIYMTDTDGKCIFVNRSWCEMTGMQEKNVLEDGWAKALHPHDRERVFSDWHEKIKAGGVWENEYRYITSEDKVVWVYGRATSILDESGNIKGYVGVTVDISERKRVEQNLLLAKSSIDEAGEGIFWIDKDARFVNVNLAGCRLLGYSKEELLSMTVPDIDPTFPIERVPSLWEELREKRCLSFETTHRHKNGNILPVKVSLSYIKFEDIEYSFAFVQDITDRKRFEKTLEDASKKSEMASIAKSQFLANMSHEIRTPLSVILGVADLMDISRLTDEQKSQICLLKGASKSLLLIADDLRDVSKIEAGKLELNLAEHSLKKLLDSTESIMRPFAENKGLQFSVICDSTLPSRIYTDYGRVHQCLLNIIGNAVKFTEKGHIHLKVALEYKEENPLIRFDVEDTGIGIPQDKLESLFNSYTQVDIGKTRQYSGTGLGLAITKEISKMLGGAVTVTSEVSNGSVFSLVIPAGIDVLNREEPVDRLVSESKTREISRFSGKVLVAEDYEGIRKVLKSLLEHLGLEVTLAGDGKEAVEIVFQQSFDLVLMDVQMPVLNGFMATRELRRKGIKTPIIALTAYAMESDRNECLEAGCDDYLSKPINQKELKRILSKYVRAENNSA